MWDRRGRTVLLLSLGGVAVACSSFTAAGPTAGSDAGVLDGAVVDSAVGADAGTDPATAVSAGSGIGCALRASGAVACWGDAAITAGPTDVCGALRCVTRAIEIALPGPARSVSAGNGFVCAVVAGDANTVWCWGRGTFGTLGDGQKNTTSATPLKVMLPGSALDVVAGRGNACARVLATDGSNAVDVYCWGSNTIGLNDRGPGDTVEPPSLVDVTKVRGATALDLSVTDPAHACVIGPNPSNQVTCWGANQYGELGSTPVNYACTVDGPYRGTSYSCEQVPAAASDARASSAIATGLFATCTAHSGKVACWGFDGWGEHATGMLDNGVHSTPVESTLLADKAVTRLSGRSAHVCAVLSTGKAMCWGASGQNQLANDLAGEPSTTLLRRAESTPHEIPGLPAVTDISAGEDFTLALAGGNVYAWGLNTLGQLGHAPALDQAGSCEGTGVCNGTPTVVALP